MIAVLKGIKINPLWGGIPPGDAVPIPTPTQPN